MINQNFVFLGAFFNLIGSSSYAIDTYRGKTSPNRVTFFLWGLAPLIAFASQISAGIGIRSLMTFMVGFGPMIVFLISFKDKKAFWKITMLDIACGALSILALILWIILKTGTIAIILSISADLLAGIPTLKKAYKEPETESYNVFFFGAISAAITLLTINEWSIASAAFPIYIFLICGTLFLLIFRKQGIQLIKT